MEHGLLKKIFDAARDKNGDPAVISYGLPFLFKARDVNRVSKLSRLYKQGKEAWLPEMLALFGGASLSIQEQRRHLKQVFGHGIYTFADNITVRNMAGCCAAIGRIGFSFPQWRFVTQGFNEVSLIERFGYEKLERSTDVRNECLPKSNPERDEYGTGFVRHDNNWTVEYRRAYILCSRQSEKSPATIVVRNNSYFFGRDRLPEPAYISEGRFSHKELQSLKPENWNNGRFKSLQEFFQGDAQLSRNVRTVMALLNHFDREDLRLSNWMASDVQGRKALVDFADFALGRRSPEQEKPPFYIARNECSKPPWFPQNVIPVTPEIVEKLKENMGWTLGPAFSSGWEGGSKTVLLSGPSGDLPLKPGFSLT